MAKARHFKFLPHNAVLSTVYAIVLFLSVCLSHSGNVSKRLNIGSSKLCRTIAPYSSFLTTKFTSKFEWDHPLRDQQLQVGRLKLATFDKKCTITRKRYKIDA